jgi:hydroxymethylglutaryl-CoA lyase
MDIDTGIDVGQVLETARFCEQALGRELHGRITRSGLNPLP